MYTNIKAISQCNNLSNINFINSRDKHLIIEKQINILQLHLTIIIEYSCQYICKIVICWCILPNTANLEPIFLHKRQRLLFATNLQFF